MTDVVVEEARCKKIGLTNEKVFSVQEELT